MENQPNGGQRDELTTRVAYVLSRNDPSDAAALVLNEIPPGPTQDEAVMTVLHQWAELNRIRFALWIVQWIAMAYWFYRLALQARADR